MSISEQVSSENTMYQILYFYLLFLYFLFVLLNLKLVSSIVPGSNDRGHTVFVLSIKYPMCKSVELSLSVYILVSLILCDPIDFKLRTLLLDRSVGFGHFKLCCRQEHDKHILFPSVHYLSVSCSLLPWPCLLNSKTYFRFCSKLTSLQKPFYIDSNVKDLLV